VGVKVNEHSNGTRRAVAGAAAALIGLVALETPEAAEAAGNAQQTPGSARFTVSVEMVTFTGPSTSSVYLDVNGWDPAGSVLSFGFDGALTSADMATPMTFNRRCVDLAAKKLGERGITVTANQILLYKGAS
jgi:hypothetical protein